MMYLLWTKKELILALYLEIYFFFDWEVGCGFFCGGTGPPIEAVSFISGIVGGTDVWKLSTENKSVAH